MHQEENWALLVHTFCPVIRQASPSCSARVFNDARSLPASGSLKPWHQTSSAVRMLPR